MSEPGHPVRGDERDDMPEVELTIDGMRFRVAAASMTGAELRRLAHPPIPGDRDIWIETEDGSDRRLAHSETVAVTDGMRLFSVPTHISAG